MTQLAYVSEREGGGPRALEASNAAHDLLMTLGTDPSHGMLPTPKDGEDDEAEAESEGGHSKPSSSAGQPHLLLIVHSAFPSPSLPSPFPPVPPETCRSGC